VEGATGQAAVGDASACFNGSARAGGWRKENANGFDCFECNSASVSHPLRVLAGWTNWLAALWLRRAAIKEIQQPDDREPRDIGVSRGEINAAVNGCTQADAMRGRFR
jgi:uncharacterized protein YjiS (DUF1127 family)